MAGNDLTSTFIANTYQNLVQMPNITEQNFYNGLGATISVINRDGIGTVKMYFPPNGKLYDAGNTDGFTDLNTGVGTWEGWMICAGQAAPGFTHTLPDLRERFVVGASVSYGGGGSYSIGYMGGEEKHQLSEPELASHTHTNTLTWQRTNLLPGTSGLWQTALGAVETGANNVGVGGSINPAGNNVPHENRPPYCALVYVIRVS